jgi:hypothetical protein
MLARNSSRARRACIGDAIPAERDAAANDEGEAESEHDKVGGVHGRASSRAISLTTIALMLLSLSTAVGSSAKTRRSQERDAYLSGRSRRPVRS